MNFDKDTKFGILNRHHRKILDKAIKKGKKTYSVLTCFPKKIQKYCGVHFLFDLHSKPLTTPLQKVN